MSDCFRMVGGNSKLNHHSALVSTHRYMSRVFCTASVFPLHQQHSVKQGM